MTDDAFFSTASEVFDWMETNCTQGIRPGLERMEWILERLNHPERRLKFIHIAGTNGKGSTAAMIASVLQESGFPTGMFISPYMKDWNERISMDGQPIPEKSFVYWAGRLAPLVEEMEGDQVTPFEFWTLVAILYFAKEAVPWFVVWETGLGGRLDSTNVVYPLVSVITNVGHDHTYILGEGISDIAQEKAGIIKPGVPVVTGCQAEALEVVESVAKEKSSKLYRLRHEFDLEVLSQGEEGGSFQFQGPFRHLEQVSVPLRGAHQLENGAVALMTLEVLRQYYATVMDDEDILKGMAEVDWPGRLERVARQPEIILDGAHNQEGAEALASAIRDFRYDRLHLLIGVLEDKDVDAILRPLLPLADRVMVTGVSHHRGLDPRQLREKALQLCPDVEIDWEPRADKALQQLRAEANDQDAILVTGTLFLISEIKKTLGRESSF